LKGPSTKYGPWGRVRIVTSAMEYTEIL
jgi:hypothetical protein